MKNCNISIFITLNYNLPSVLLKYVRLLITEQKTIINFQELYIFIKMQLFYMFQEIHLSTFSIENLIIS